MKKAITVYLIKLLKIFLQEDIKSQTPYHPAQLEKIFTVMGYPQLTDWPDIVKMPGYQKLKEDFDKLVSVHPYPPGP